MGFGDWILATGQAKVQFARTGRKVAFGDGKTAWWCDVFDHNPKIAHPRDLARGLAVDWIPNYKGHRPYHDPARTTKDRWAYSDWRAVPGEIFLSDLEQAFGESRAPRGPFVLIEPNVKPTAPNKQWPWTRYETVAAALARLGWTVAQMGPGDTRWLPPPVTRVVTPNFRLACAVMARARFYIGPEGGLHHAAAAFAVPGVVLFGGFCHPRNTGYDLHRNLFVGDAPCGARAPCRHCQEAMAAITAEQVIAAARAMLA